MTRIKCQGEEKENREERKKENYEIQGTAGTRDISNE